MARTSDVADYLLCKGDAEAGDLISNLKLQKLLYYAQGYHLAIHNKPLFSDSIEAWAHGPVVPSMYRKFKNYEGGAVDKPSNFNPSVLDAKTRSFLDEIYKVFGQFSAWKLRNMTHAEPPWRTTEQNCTISHAVLQRYFKTQLA